MSTFAILVRNPRTLKLVAITDDDGNIVEFENEDEAVKTAEQSKLCQAWRTYIIEVPDNG